MTPAGLPRPPGPSVTNTAKDGAQVGMQVGVINGPVYVHRCCELLGTCRVRRRMRRVLEYQGKLAAAQGDGE